LGLRSTKLARIGKEVDGSTRTRVIPDAINRPNASATI
jgi:hypothetical protein